MSRLSAKEKAAVKIGLIGNVIEWYDFAIYGFLTPILSKLFFPTDNEFTSILLTLSVFALGFLMRPFGGVLLDILGTVLVGKQLFLFPSF